MSRQAYYKQRQRHALLARVEVDVLAWVRALRSLMPTLGARKLYARCPVALPFGRDKFFALLARKGLLVPRRRASAPRTTYADVRVRWRNVFRDLELTRPGQAVVGDITYVRLDDGHCYLSLLTDAFSRKIVGWYVSSSLSSSGCVAAFRRMVRCYGNACGLVHHTDRGTQYMSHEYGKEMLESGVEMSVTQDNHCAENAMAERVNGILKQEFMLGATYRSVHQVRRAVAQSVRIYNQYRPHTALGYQTPDEVHYNKTTVLNFCQPI